MTAATTFQIFKKNSSVFYAPFTIPDQESLPIKDTDFFLIAVKMCICGIAFLAIQDLKDLSPLVKDTACAYSFSRLRPGFLRPIIQRRPFDCHEISGAARAMNSPSGSFQDIIDDSVSELVDGSCTSLFKSAPGTT